MLRYSDEWMGTVYRPFLKLVMSRAFSFDFRQSSRPADALGVPITRTSRTDFFLVRLRSEGMRSGGQNMKSRQSIPLGLRGWTKEKFVPW